MSEISQTVMDFIMAIQFAVRVEVSQEPKEYDEAYKTWEVRSAVLGTKLEAYFAPSIAKDWDALEDQLSGLYNLTRTSDRVGREAPTNVLLAKLGLRRSEPPGDDRERQEAARRDAWERLRDPILDCKISLIQKVLEERVNELQKPPLLERLRRRIAA